MCNVHSAFLHYDIRDVPMSQCPKVPKSQNTDYNTEIRIVFNIFEYAFDPPLAFEHLVEF